MPNYLFRQVKSIQNVKKYCQNCNGHAKLFVLPSIKNKYCQQISKLDGDLGWPQSCMTRQPPFQPPVEHTAPWMIMVGQLSFKIRRWPRQTWVLHDLLPLPPSNIVGAQLSLVGQFVPHQLPPYYSLSPTCSPIWPVFCITTLSPP